MKNNKSNILALKYRPQVFKDLIGQEIIAETISNSIKLNKTPNAYLLTGIRGVGKTTTARLIAKALNCKNNDIEKGSCQEKNFCSNCEEIGNSNHIDVLEMDAASKTGIDDVRELIESAKYNPTNAKFKIYIIDECQMLSKQAWNGLLKTLEEPPENLRFIFATTEPRKIPITILSRCQRFDLKRVSLSKILEHLKKILKIEGGKISEEGLMLLSRASEGSVRDGISLLDRAMVFQSLNPDKTVNEKDVRKMLGLADKSKLIHLMKFIFDGDEKNSIKLLNEFFEDGLDAKNFLNDFLELIYLFGRRINLGPIEKDLFISESELQLIEQNSSKLSIQDLGLFWQLTLKTIEDLKIVSSELIALEMFVIQLIHIKNIAQENERSEELNPPPIFTGSTSKKKKIEESEKTENSSNFAKEQLRIVEQVKTLKGHKTEDEKKAEGKYQVKSFSELINLAEQKREMELKYDLERNVRLVNFEVGKIDMNFNESLNKNFIKKLSQSLNDWTGKRWMITLSKNDNVKTFYEDKIDKKTEALKKEKESPIYKEMLEKFPDADLIKVEQGNE